MPGTVLGTFHASLSLIPSREEYYPHLTDEGRELQLELNPGLFDPKACAFLPYFAKLSLIPTNTANCSDSLATSPAASSLARPPRGRALVAARTYEGEATDREGEWRGRRSIPYELHQQSKVRPNANGNA